MTNFKIKITVTQTFECIASSDLDKDKLIESMEERGIDWDSFEKRADLSQDISVEETDKPVTVKDWSWFFGELE